jgi:hypothetical protein
MSTIYESGIKDTNAVERKPLLGWRDGRLLRLLVMLVLPAMLPFAYATWRTGSPLRTIPYLTGQRLMFDVSKIDLGTIDLGTEKLIVPVHVQNTADKEMRLLGAYLSCGCMSLEELPLTIPARSNRRVEINLTLPDAETDFTLSVKFFSDDPVSPSTHVLLSGRVKKCL